MRASARSPTASRRRRSTRAACPARRGRERCIPGRDRDDLSHETRHLTLDRAEAKAVAAREPTASTACTPRRRGRPGARPRARSAGELAVREVPGRAGAAVAPAVEAAERVPGLRGGLPEPHAAERVPRHERPSPSAANPSRRRWRRARARLLIRVRRMPLWDALAGLHVRSRLRARAPRLPLPAFTRVTTRSSSRATARPARARTSRTTRPSTTASRLELMLAGTWTLDDLVAPPRRLRASRLPPLGVRERSARPRAAPGGDVARRSARPAVPGRCDS